MTGYRHEGPVDIVHSYQFRLDLHYRMVIDCIQTTNVRLLSKVFKDKVFSISYDYLHFFWL